MLSLIPLLREHDEIHRKLYLGEAWTKADDPTTDEWLPVSKYMGLLEGIGVLARNRLLNLDVLDNLVSYRVAELVSDDYIRGKVEKDPFWVELLSFWRSLDDLRQRKKRPILCEEHPAPTEEPRAPSGQ